MNCKWEWTKCNCETWKYVKTLWSIVCFVATISTMIWQLVNFIHGPDATIVHYKAYNKERIDVYPSIGICFSMAFDENKLKIYGNEVNPLAYTSFLAGFESNLTDKMFQVDYEKVTIDFD